MTPDEIRQVLATELSADIALTTAEIGDPCIYVPSELWVKANEVARHNAELKFDFLRSITATDYPDEKQIEVTNHLFSYAYKHAITLKCRVDRDAPILPTITHVWPAANWHEREAFDLLGVQFSGHPNLKRLLLPEDWVGYPLRKDYKQEEYYQGVPTAIQGPAADSNCGTTIKPKVEA